MNIPLFALVDCNNFYASCERVFNPTLEGKPIVVLSNNDGCIIARSNEAKKLGIPMGAPFFKWERFCQQHNVFIFSSNYELYGDMSQRVMSILRQYSPRMEIYSIDEAFLSLDSFNENQCIEFAIELRKIIKQQTGLPVSIGIAATKTLAKVANHIAKTQTAVGIHYLSPENKQILHTFPLDKIWGVGHRLAQQLENMQLHTAYDLQQSDPKMFRSYFSIMMEKTINELRGIPCIDLDAIQPRKQIISSRSFGKSIVSLTDLEEAVSHYTAIATAKLRKQACLASGITVYVQTNFFNRHSKHDENSIFFSFPIPTCDTGYIIHIAKKCLRTLFKKGYSYHKAGIILSDILPESKRQLDLFTPLSDKNECLMKAIDKINRQYGRNVIFHCAEGIKRDWQIKKRHCSPRYTTRWQELLKVR